MGWRAESAVMVLGAILSGWRLVECGSLYEVGVDMSDPTRWSKWGTLQLDLPHAKHAGLEGRWFVIGHELRVASGSDDEAQIAFTYAHANPSVAQWLIDTFHGC
ncbi:MAG: hypothetical protein HN396_08780 [Gemmatimonadales bacterium]|jgi:hypothetical protein|nr:hypothetical protein [Gemmatimonadales bacterium]MBT3498250.1 hypothetical protein [Gemmatimonadales bacterium]MBT3773665.1 hypothetical protein [Gemmatimonadales bacterium]MBT3959591.1 hypothetical protein [Gemmatimonadales bacterium]MBT4436841.1 hypothetical protein [Gemmatimonadales bacterium]